MADAAMESLDKPAWFIPKWFLMLLAGVVVVGALAANLLQFAMAPNTDGIETRLRGVETDIRVLQSSDQDRKEWQRRTDDKLDRILERLK